MKKRYKILLAAGAVAGTAGLALAFLPWKESVTDRVRASLEAKGFQNVRLTLARVGLRETVLQNVSIGPLTLKNISFGYSPFEFSEVTVQAGEIAVEGGGTVANIAQANISAMSGSSLREWDGGWDLKDVQIKVGTGTDAPPALAGAGMIAVRMDGAERSFRLNGRLDSADWTYSVEFSLDYPSLALAYAKMPWKGGKLVVRNAMIPLTDRTDPVKINLQVEKVSIDELMQALTGRRVSATGTVSGILPVMIEQDNSVSFGSGSLHADSPGVLSMPPDVIPGDNPQVSLTREILKNLHYQSLSIATGDTGRDDGVAILMSLKGSNPDVYNGRPVNLNIRLTGEVADYVRQNIIFLSAPEKILE